MKTIYPFIRITSILICSIMLVSCEKVPDEVPKKYMDFFPYTTMGDQFLFKSTNGNSIIVEYKGDTGTSVSKDCHGGRGWYNYIGIALDFYYGEYTYELIGTFEFKKWENRGEFSGTFGEKFLPKGECYIKSDTLFLKFLKDNSMKFVKNKGLVEVNLYSIHDKYPKLPNEVWTLIE